MDRIYPEGHARRYYTLSENEDGTVDVFLMPDETVRIVRGIIPWDGIEYDIRARYQAWCEIGEEVW